MKLNIEDGKRRRKAYLTFLVHRNKKEGGGGN